MYTFVCVYKKARGGSPDPDPMFSPSSTRTTPTGAELHRHVHGQVHRDDERGAAHAERAERHAVRKAGWISVCLWRGCKGSEGTWAVRLRSRSAWKGLIDQLREGRVRPCYWAFNRERGGGRRRSVGGPYRTNQMQQVPNKLASSSCLFSRRT